MSILGTVGIADKGDYNPSTTYVAGNSVYYAGSTWVALKSNLTGITPEEGENWKYLARGFESDSLSQIEGTDTSGVIGTAGSTVVSQALIDAIADKVMTKLIPYANIVNNFMATDPKTVLSGPMGKSLKDQLDTTNINLNKTNLKANSNFLTVGKTGAQYTTINAAINYAKTYATKTNRVTIFIYEGTYNEQIELNDNNGIDLVGIQGQTIVTYPSAYPNAPLYTCGQGYFYGITFRSAGGTSSYGMHFERQGFPNASGETVFTNCRFISDANASVGVGMGDNNTVEFRNCTFIGAATESQAIYVHNFPTAASGQTMRFINNHIYGNITVDDAPAMVGNGTIASPLILQFFNNYVEYGSFRFRKDASTQLPYVSVNHHNISIHTNSRYNTLIALNRKDYGAFFYGYSKPANKIPNSGYYDYYIPLKDANSYSIVVDNAVIQGVGDYDKTKYSIVGQTPSGFLLRDTDASGTGAGNFITVYFTILPL
ncbi:hypothetical protein [Lacrimispora saccharolytica]|uniref:Uncharacterized protein n=1 Tax=Lacrimispora saccharolytica (strain ATCC 35040 / DSM 2544 / NRCC 2533 / WM1) TaxID=610130 RepID=D9R5H8_LACSW|nr:hypothetical protein [Lacrimispora saccharolytica]ADL03384.1 hypothetical protein Closa_0759 [[Clostridium] saccharolyticum WM1]QRV18460.1 hypothetical protein I6K70_12980 [Lacrimispora saccharolytica]